MPRTLKTKAGSTVTFDNLQVRVGFDWFEEPNACIDCGVDVDLSRATGWKHLMWRCESDERHDLMYAELHPVGIDSIEAALQLVESTAPKHQTVFQLRLQPELEPAAPAPKSRRDPSVAVVPAQAVQTFIKSTRK